MTATPIRSIPVRIVGLIVALALISVVGAAAHSSPNPPVHDAAGWSLQWDDTVDGALTEDPKACNVALTGIDDRWTGTFDGPVLGSERTALFTGERSTTGRVSVWWLEQREPGYVCRYQLLPTVTDGAEETWAGTWHDSEGRSGDVVLERLPSPADASPRDRVIRLDPFPIDVIDRARPVPGGAEGGDR